jgi:hypothetical protein
VATDAVSKGVLNSLKIHLLIEKSVVKKELRYVYYNDFVDIVTRKRE